MTSAKIWLVCSVGLLAALTMFVIAGVAGVGRPIAMLLVVAGIATVAYAFVWRHRAEKIAANAQRERDATRVHQLKQQLDTSGGAVIVKGSSARMLLVLVGLLALGCAVAAVVDPGVGALAAAIFIALLAGLVALVIWPMLGKAAIAIRSEGVETPAYGLLPWSAIDGLGLREAREKGAPVMHFLDLHVVDLPARAEQMHAVVRWIRKLVPSARRAQSVQVRLAGISETPAVVYELCRSIWSARTGLDDVWLASMSEEEFQALRSSKQDAAQQPELRQLKDPDGFAARLREMQARHLGLNERADVEAKGRTRRRLITSIVSAVVLVLMMAGAWWMATR